MSKSPLFTRYQAFSSQLMNTLLMRWLVFIMTLVLTGACLLTLNDHLHHEVSQAESKLTSNQQPQQIIAPILSIPYVEHVTSINTVLDDKGESRVETKDVYNDKSAILLPEDLDIKVSLTQEDQQSWVAYQLSGTFNYSELLIEPESGKRNIRWDDAKLMIGLKNLANLHEEVVVSWDEESIPLSAGNINHKIIQSGFSAIPSEPPENADNIHTYAINFKTPLFSQLSLAPLGLYTRINIDNFQQGFDIKSDIKPIEQTETYLAWDVSPLARPYLNYWVQEELNQPFDLSNPLVSVKLKDHGHYDRFKSLLGYSPWLLCFTLFSIFALELWGRQRIAGTHYLLLGLTWSAMVYTLWAFHNAQAWQTILLISLSAWCTITSVYIGSLLGILRGFLFVGLQVLLFLGMFYYFSDSEYKQMQWLIFMLVVVGLVLLGGSRKASPPTLIT